MAGKTPSTSMIESPWLNTAECAAYAKRHTETILAALRSGQLTGSQVKKGGNWLVHRDDLDAWLRSHVAAPRRRAS